MENKDKETNDKFFCVPLNFKDLVKDFKNKIWEYESPVWMQQKFRCISPDFPTKSIIFHIDVYMFKPTYSYSWHVTRPR